MNKNIRSIILYYLRNIFCAEGLKNEKIEIFNNWGWAYGVHVFGERMQVSYDKVKLLKNQDSKDIVLTEQEKIIFKEMEPHRIIDFCKEKVLAAHPPKNLDDLGRIIRHADRISSAFQLSKTEKEVMRLIVADTNIEAVRNLSIHLFQNNMLNFEYYKIEKLQILGKLLLIPQKNLNKVFLRESTFFKYGLIRFDNNHSNIVTPALKDALSASSGNQ
jgi:hypothetical protein